MVVDQRLAQLPRDRAMVGSNLAASIVSSWESAVFFVLCQYIQEDNRFN